MMKLTIQRKVLAGVLGLVGVSLLLDRVLFAPGMGGPAEAIASVVADDVRPLRHEGAGKLSAKLENQDALKAHQGTSLADRLDVLAQAEAFDPEQIGDAFVPSTDWLMQAPTSNGAVKQLDQSDQFLREHRLHAVMGSGGHGLAIINGKTRRVGQSVDGFKLVQVKRRSAILTKDKARVELQLDISEPASSDRDTSDVDTAD